MMREKLYRRNDFYLNATGLNKNIGSIYCLSADFLKVALERIGADRLGEQ